MLENSAESQPLGAICMMGHECPRKNGNLHFENAVLGSVKLVVMRLQHPTKLRSPSIQEYGADHGHHMIETIAIQGSENVYPDRLNH